LQIVTIKTINIIIKAKAPITINTIRAAGKEILLELLIIFIFAGVVQMLDYENVIDQLNLAYSEEKRYFLNLRKHYHHYLYFIIVSLTTVGYGDITPMSILSQFTMVVFIVFILAVIPNQTDELITLSNAQTIYERNEYISGSFS